LLTTFVFGAAPAWQLSQTDTGERLKGGLRGSTSGPGTRRLRSAFVIAQVALAVVLSVATGLLVKAFVHIGAVETGFTADSIATARLRLPASSYPGPVQRAALFTRLTERLTGRADIAATGAITQLPMSGAFLGSTFAVPAGESRPVDIEFGADLRGVTPGYFDTMGIRLVGGREFSPHDDADSARVAIIDATLARRFWPDGQVVGKRLRWVRTNESLEIVGVAAAVRHYGLAAPSRETVYRPYQQYAAIPEMFVVARSAGGYDVASRAVLEEVRRLDPNQPVADARRMDTLVEESLGQPRFNTLLLTVLPASRCCSPPSVFMGCCRLQ
jgi:putative ABC transport system permease protein